VTATGPLSTSLTSGGRANENRLKVDGLNGNPPGNQPPTYVADVGNSQEVTFTTSGGLGEAETAGLVMNIVPKTGGNRIEGAAYFSGTGEHLQADNFTDELRAAGLAAATPISKVYDLNGAVGGPIKKDKIWFFVNARTQGSTRVTANQFYNLNAGDPNKWLYAPDSSRPGFSDRTWENVSGRATLQLTPRHKVGVFWDEQVVCRKCEGTTTGLASPAQIVSPEADGVGATKPLRVQQVTWSSPATSRLLFDAGFGTTYYGGATELIGTDARSCSSPSSAAAARPTAAFGIFYDRRTGTTTTRAPTVARVVSRHGRSLKFGTPAPTSPTTARYEQQQSRFQVNNGVPNQI
jgi:hypothetical protein